MFGKLANHFSSLTDVRYVTDPWGLGMKIPVLRAGAEEWTKWNEEHAGPSGIDETFKRAQLARMADSIVEQLDEPDKPGFRRRRKLTKTAAGDARKQSMRAVLREAIAEMPLEQLSKATDPNDLKLALARVGMPEEHAGKRYTWSGVEDEHGEVMPFTLENRLRLLGWQGTLTENTATGERVFGPPLPPADSALDGTHGSVRIVEFDGNPRDEAGNLLWVPADREYGDRPVGDAITDWLFDESEAGDTIHSEVVEAAAENLGGSPSGASATSAP